LCVLLASWGERDPVVARGTVLAVLPLLVSAVYVPLWSLLAARMEYPLREAIVVASRVAELVLLVACSLAGAGFLPLVGVSAAAQTVPLGLTLWVLRFRVRVSLRWDETMAKSLLTQAAPLGVASIVALVYGRVNGVLLARLAGYEAVGLYSAACKFLTLALTLPYVVDAAVFPVMARVEHDRATVQVVFQRAFDYLTLLALPLGVGGTVLGPLLVALVYGPGFERAVEPLRVLLWATGFMFATWTCRQLLVAGGQQTAHLMLLVGGAVSNVALNLWWIPTWGIVGAAWATLCAEAGVLVASYWVVRRRLGLDLQWGGAIRVLAATAVMAVVSAVSAPLGPWLSVAIGAGAYLAATAVLGLWPREARALLESVGMRVGAS
jgi:O-antigen/teichoic acid export membrane protein